MAVTTGVRREWISMLYLSIVLLCGAGLFLALLEDRYRFWTTLAVTAVVYGLSLGLSVPLRGLIPDPAAGDQAACAAGCLLFFVSSLFLYRNNPLQKFFVALLTLCDFAFLGAFVPLFLGVLPFSTAGGLGGALSVLFTTTATGASPGSWRACAFCCWGPTWCAWGSWTSSSAPRSPRAGCCWRPCSTEG